MKHRPIRRRSIAGLSSLLVASALMVGCGAQATSSAPPAMASADDGLDQLSDEALARKLLEVTGAARTGKLLLDDILETLGKMQGLPAVLIERLKQNARADDLIDLLVPVYLKHYERPLMIAAIRFYDSEPGRALIALEPALLADAGEVGGSWGKAFAEKTLRELQAEANDGR